MCEGGECSKVYGSVRQSEFELVNTSRTRQAARILSFVKARRARGTLVRHRNSSSTKPKMSLVEVKTPCSEALAGRDPFGLSHTVSTSADQGDPRRPRARCRSTVRLRALRHTPDTHAAPQRARAQRESSHTTLCETGPALSRLYRLRPCARVPSHGYHIASSTLTHGSTLASIATCSSRAHTAARQRSEWH